MSFSRCFVVIRVSPFPTIYVLRHPPVVGNFLIDVCVNVMVIESHSATGLQLRFSWSWQEQVYKRGLERMSLPKRVRRPIWNGLLCGRLSGTGPTKQQMADILAFRKERDVWDL